MSEDNNRKKIKMLAGKCINYIKFHASAFVASNHAWTARQNEESKSKWRKPVIVTASHDVIKGVTKVKARNKESPFAHTKEVFCS